MQLAHLPTPCLVLDRPTLHRNADRMRARATALGVSLRPHLKTAKSAAVAEVAMAGGGAAVSTLREAEYFGAAGIRDLVWAVCVPPGKLERTAALVATGVDLILLTDDVHVARAIASHEAPMRALIEIDSGGRRTGVPPDGPALLEIADALGARSAGVLTHAGHSYGCVGPSAIAEVAEQERSSAVAAARRLRDAGFPCPTVSVGSTPTAVHAAHLDGATELRPGAYVFMDLFQAAVGVCAVGDIAISVLSTVISRQGDQVVLDAGGLALSKDRSTAGTPHDAGYGLLCDLHGQVLPEAPRIAEVHQEHGLVPRAPAGLSVGDRVRILPNHACMTAAAYDEYWVVDGGTAVADRWGRCNGW